jgi:hypothetical protein
MHLLNFWTINIVLFFLFNTQRFGDWILCPSSGKSLIQAQSVDLVPLSQLSWFLPEHGDRIQSPKRRALNRKQHNG